MQGTIYCISWMSSEKAKSNNVDKNISIQFYEM